MYALLEPIGSLSLVSFYQLKRKNNISKIFLCCCFICFKGFNSFRCKIILYLQCFMAKTVTFLGLNVTNLGLTIAFLG